MFFGTSKNGSFKGNHQRIALVTTIPVLLMDKIRERYQLVGALSQYVATDYPFQFPSERLHNQTSDAGTKIRENQNPSFFVWALISGRPRSRGSSATSGAIFAVEELPLRGRWQPTCSFW